MMMKNICGCWSCSEIVTALSQVDLGIEELREKKDKIKKVIRIGKVKVHLPISGQIRNLAAYA